MGLEPPVAGAPPVLPPLPVLPPPVLLLLPPLLLPVPLLPPLPLGVLVEWEPEQSSTRRAITLDINQGFKRIRSRIETSLTVTMLDSTRLLLLPHCPPRFRAVTALLGYSCYPPRTRLAFALAVRAVKKACPRPGCCGHCLSRTRFRSHRTLPQVRSRFL